MMTRHRSTRFQACLCGLLATFAAACHGSSGEATGASSAKAAQIPATAQPAAAPKGSPLDLRAARQGFRTRILGDTRPGTGPAPRPPEGVFQLIHYPSAVGELAAYITPPPAGGGKQPAVLWAHGGYGGIDAWFWEIPSPANDQTRVSPFWLVDRSPDLGSGCRA